MSAAEGGEKASAPDVEALIEQTGRDPRLGPQERETTVTFATDEGTARIHTEEPALIRRCLAHTHVGVDELRVVDGDGVRRVSPDAALANGGLDGRVAALRGRVPVACLLVKAAPRKDDGHAAVVSEGVYDE